jgi:hypothetical protein
MADDNAGASVKFLIVGLGGLVAGAMLTLSFAYSFRLQDTYSRNLMGVLQNELSALRADVRGGRCTDPSIPDRARKLNLLSADIQVAVPRRWGDDREFQDLARIMLAETRAFEAAIPNECAPLQAAVNRIATACQDCHDRFRGK